MKEGSGIEKQPLKNSKRKMSVQQGDVPNSTSSHQLIDDDDSVNSRQPIQNEITERNLKTVTRTEWTTVLILCFINLINYMDRYTMAGILGDIQSYFSIGDDQGGLLQTVFVISYMVFAPLFGYLGDRYNRKIIMASGVFLWSLTTLLGSFMNNFGFFITFRALVGVGEASYSTIAPTIISDLFAKDIRSKMLALFYFAIPVGSGLGYIAGSAMAHIGGSWHWALRVTPALGLVAVILIKFIQDPVRGHSEQSMDLEPTSYTDDLKSLLKNRSFMLSTAGFTCVAFVTGALAWWGPKFIHSGMILQPGNRDVTINDVSFKFGIVAMLAGVTGVPLGSLIASRLRPLYPSCDPLICATGMLVAAPLLYFAAITPGYNTNLCFALMFFGQVSMNMNWPLVADMLLYVVIPTRRSTAEAFQILISHTFGDAGSPYLIGVISEALKPLLSPSGVAVTASALLLNTQSESSIDKISLVEKYSNYNSSDYSLDGPNFRSMQYALFTTSFVEVLGGLFFLLTAVYITRDRSKAEMAVEDGRMELSESSTSGDSNAYSPS
ncbi:protein spinster-like isoform X2 [Ctenocephalides felis]|uniref:protein spinster-like isoform X2 n=1 Tax=Ctenocephalides felis TaxID=7515 RepID=UPI000E6E21F4|nr:protein spinster-like isoform X2 [Ctenocephalides felis]